MKKTIYGVLAFAALTLTACGGAENAEENTKEEEQKQEKVVADYVLNTEESTLEWTGSWEGGENDGNSHFGEVDMTAGEIHQDGEDFNGHFTVDITSIDVQDLEEEDGRPRLMNRLRSEYFFNIEEYPNTDVKVKEITDGNAKITLVIAGVKIDKSVPVDVKVEDEKLQINGEFNIDIEEVEMDGMQLDPEKPENGTVSSEIGFKLNAVLNKQ